MDGGPGVEGGTDAAPPDAFQLDTSPKDVGMESSGSCTGTPPAEDAGNGYISNPTPVITTGAKAYKIHLELNAFTNYGVADDKADILYTGDIGTWTFNIPATPIVSATLAVSLVATDGTAVPASDFTYQLWSGSCEYTTPAPLPHGLPPASQFSNWVEVDEPAALTPSTSFTVTIWNTSLANPGDWIAIDWMELRVVTP